jgi:hypothetical protein
MDAKVSKLSFSVNPWGYPPSVFGIVPHVDGIGLTELVDTFEREHSFGITGNYDGLIPQYFNFGGSLYRYYLGQFSADSYWARRDRIVLLSCKGCGEFGCWPLECHVQVIEDQVLWTRFRQPHRLQQDYSDFGPFIFDAVQYRTALAHLQSIFQWIASMNPLSASKDNMPLS